MTTFRAQVVFPYFTNIPEDVATNTFHFAELTPIGLAGAADALTPILDAFYTAIYAEQGGIASYINPLPAVVKFYDLAQPLPRVPDIRNLGLTSTRTTSTIPTEVALCLSFQGDRAPGEPQARRRGRIYIPGLLPSAITASTTSTYPVINPAFRAEVAAQATALRDASVTASLRWSVWSEVNQSGTFVTNGWVDDSPDTQRRRSVNTTTRTLWT